MSEITIKTSPKYLQQEETLIDLQECKDLIHTLPKQKGLVVSHIYQYQRFWFAPAHLQSLITCQKHFKARDSDVFLITTPKSGSTWLKALVFALLNRNRYPVSKNLNHPLLTRNPHDLVPFLETKLYADNKIPDIALSGCSGLFSTHVPYFLLPESIRVNPGCKIVYLCRQGRIHIGNPKDTFVSLWHFTNKLRSKEMGSNSMSDVFERFCEGVSAFGPFWDHVLEYWNQSRENPGKILFLRFEDVKERPEACLGRLSDFLGCPFSRDEEESGLVDEILRLCSFDHLRGLEVNRNGRLESGMANDAFFRKGEVGDWRSCLDGEMAERLDRITEDKFRGSGLEL